MPEPDKKPDQVVIKIPVDLSFLGLATATARQYAHIIGFSEEDLYKIELAVEETVSNIIHHGLLAPEDKPAFEMSLSVSDPFGICIRIGEKGIPFDPSRAADYDPARSAENPLMSGLGLQLIRGMMDKVSYRNLGLQGKETVLIKYGGADVQDGTAAVGPLRATEERRDNAPAPIPFSVRRLNPDEAIEVSRGAYRSHGYTFFNDIIYYPEKIRELNETNLMISAVAVTESNEFMGHGALLLSESDARIGELNFVFVNLEYRKQSCLLSIGLFLFQAAVERNLTGIYTYAVTVHTFTQKPAIRAGARPIGVLLATSPDTWKFKGIDEHLGQRISVVLLFQYIRKPQGRIIHAPVRHAAMIRTLYTNLGAGHTIEEAPASPGMTPERDSQIRTEISETENCAEIWLTRAGGQTVGEIRQILRKLCVQGIAAITFFVPLEDEKAIAFVPEFETLGFFFAGILPESAIGDVLILQYLNNIDIDYLAVHVMPGETETLLDYIRGCDPNRER